MQTGNEIKISNMTDSFSSSNKRECPPICSTKYNVIMFFLFNFYGSNKTAKESYL